jgi:ribulose-5-phosphate 4-epimerase/fuculose-1-phosphate aldolase
MERDEDTIAELKEKLITANGILDMEDIIRPQGHISVRIPGTDTFLITRAIAPGMATIDDIVVVNALDAEVISGKYTSTFGEVMAHAAIYQKRKDVNSVAHTHSLYVRVLSIAATGKTPLLPISFEIMKVAYEPETIGFYKEIWHLSKMYSKACFEVTDLLGENRVVILKAHGAMIATKSIEETTAVAINLEEAAKLQVMAGSLGPLVPFTAEEKARQVGFLKPLESRGGTASVYGRAWEYYKFVLSKNSLPLTDKH